MNKWTKYKTSHEGVGTFVSVWLDEDNGLVKRTFDGDHCGEGVSKRTSKADINIDRTMSKNPDKNPSRQTRAIPNILEQKGSEAYTEFLTPEFNPLATQRNI